MAIPAEFQQNQLSDPNAIYGFFGDYRWLSNFHLSSVVYEGQVFPSVENAFQAAKVDKADRDLFLTCTPSEAKKMGREVDMIYPVKYWDAIKVAIMSQLIQYKYSQPELGSALKATRGKYLEETNWWNDKFWGVCRGVGQNVMGYLTMYTRSSL